MFRLNPRHEAFCRAYVEGANASEAARAAGYSDDSAAQQGWRLLKNPRVVQRLAELRHAVVERQCRADALLAKLEIAFAAAIDKDQPAAAARIVETQAKLGLLLAKAGLAGGEALPEGAEPTRAAVARIARVVGVPVPRDEAVKSR